MRTTFALFAALAAVLNSTAYSQPLVEFDRGGVVYVGVPVETWEAIVARRLDANTINRSRARAIALLRSEIADADTIANTYRRDVEEARKRERDALIYAATAHDESAELLLKLKRRTPWATAMKIELCLVVATGAIITFHTLTR